jgi:hypothetical protein
MAFLNSETVIMSYKALVDYYIPPRQAQQPSPQPSPQQIDNHGFAQLDGSVLEKFAASFGCFAVTVVMAAGYIHDGLKNFRTQAEKDKFYSNLSNVAIVLVCIASVGTICMVQACRACRRRN